MRISEHGLKRAQQRGIHPALIELICQYGSYSRRPGGVAGVTLGGKGVDKATKDIKKVLQAISKLKDVTVIVSDDGKVLTTYHNSS